MAGKFELKKGASGKYSFNLKAGNGQVIGRSETYSSESAMEKGVASVKANGPGATVQDLTAA